MKKLMLAISFLVPAISFAANVDGVKTIDVFQEQCAKERDPLKRQNYCHMLDSYSNSQVRNAPFQQEIATV